MSNTAEQITTLFKQGNDATEIAQLLELELTDVLLILQGSGLLTAKNIAKNNKRKAKIVNSVVEGEPPDIIIVDQSESAEDVYKKHQLQIARNLVSIAISEPNNELHASVITKAAIYCNEEATGRNEARAKKQNNSLLLNLAEILQHAQNAKDRVNQVLGVSPGETIDIGGEPQLKLVNSND